MLRPPVPGRHALTPTKPAAFGKDDARGARNEPCDDAARGGCRTAERHSG